MCFQLEEEPHDSARVTQETRVNLPAKKTVGDERWWHSEWRGHGPANITSQRTLARLSFKKKKIEQLLAEVMRGGLR